MSIRMAAQIRSLEERMEELEKMREAFQESIDRAEKMWEMWCEWQKMPVDAVGKFVAPPRPQCIDDAGYLWYDRNGEIKKPLEEEPSDGRE